MDTNSIFFALCILAKFLSVSAKESDGPTNIARLSNTKVIITCAVSEDDSSHMDWAHQNRYLSSPHVLTNNTESNISTNYLMIRSKNEESLVINSVQLRDAGIYYCIKINTTEGATEEVGGYLIVLASDPTCDVENVTVMENDYIRLQCSVSYGGFWRPVMEWTQLRSPGKEKIDDSILLNATESQQYINQTSQQYTNQTASLQILAKPYHGDISFVCNTHFGYRDMLMKHKVSKNTPDYNHSWKSPKINVLYGPRNVSIYPASDTLYPGDKLSCTAIGNPEPEYEWIDNETGYNRSHVGSNIDIDQSMIREQPYVFRCRARNSVSESFATITFKVQSRFPPVYFAIVAVWLLCTLLLIAIIFAIRRKCVKDQHIFRCTDRNERSYAVSYSNSRGDRIEPNGHIVRDERIGVLNANGCGDYVDLLEVQPRYEARNLSEGRAAENSVDHTEETHPKNVGADGTQYVQMNIRPDDQEPTTRPVVHHSTIQVSNYASIDHTHKVPKRRK